MDNQPAFENPDKKSLKRLRTISAIERETATSANLNEAIERLETIKDKYLDSAYFQVILANI
jgi:Mg2+ and Co2+ transporter CorA